ncbi:TlpA family protein disulfide reductase [Embleya scabrispora]|uniref:TlpA family protein disulfide reductase n=1 Tax=Embleya scabrispora TaxID=159449 RepID=UPI000372D8EE|nr:redoxin family protein [Embleya scabrispora]MYS85309.1 redoxin domain-containing protein [Streptomyces sp. SID5474]
MSYVVAGLALLAAATLVNALLSLAVVRGWRATMAASTPAAHAPAPAPGPPALAVQEGEHSPAFTLHTPRGDVTESALTGHPALICFLRPNCGPTRNSLPVIERWVEANTPSGACLVAVISGESPEADPLIEAVGPLTKFVATEPPNGPVARAFGVRHHPSFVLLDADGTVTETGIGQGSLPALDLLSA